MEKQERKSLLDTCVKHLNYEREDLATYDGRQRRDRQPLFTPVAFSRYTRTEALGRPLIPHLWYEGELACLFGEPKSAKLHSPDKSCSKSPRTPNTPSSISTSRTTDTT